MELVKSSIYLPPDDEYEMQIDEAEEEEDEEMKVISSVFLHHVPVLRN